MRRLKGRRVLSAVGVLAIAATGAAWSGCGDDAEDEANEIIDNAQEQVDEAVDAADEQSQELQDEVEQQVDEAQESAQDAVDAAQDGNAEDVQEAVDEATQDAQDAADQALEEAQQQIDEAQGELAADRSGGRRDDDLAPVAARVAELDPAGDRTPVAERQGAGAISGHSTNATASGVR